ncbi:MAG TPA: inositol monophosphatase family protein [Anaeromyxobacteraceae bacterium]|nr:inositol monophosphatase family protein [Anaeromyxobacteraceae bacterium]
MGRGAAARIGELRSACAEAARLGGQVLRQRWGMRRTIDYKGGIDLVTDADRASEEAVLGFIEREFPGAAIVAEESGTRSAVAGAPGDGLRWYVDPLDGTTNYAHGVPHFAVNVAVADPDGLAAGATLDPLREEIWLAGRGEGAWLGGERLRVSETSDLKRALLCTGFPYDIQEDPDPLLRLFRAYIQRARAVRRFGAAALDLAYVASGRFDGFWEAKLKPWDVAPGILLVREAGGAVSDFVGGDDFLLGGTICAAGPALHPRLLEVLAEVRGG